MIYKNYPFYGFSDFRNWKIKKFFTLENTE